MSPAQPVDIGINNRGSGVPKDQFITFRTITNP